MLNLDGGARVFLTIGCIIYWGSNVVSRSILGLVKNLAMNNLKSILMLSQLKKLIDILEIITKFVNHP